MSYPSPRPADVIKARLSELQAARTKIQDELIVKLHTIDALDRRITTALDELTDARRDPV